MSASAGGASRGETSTERFLRVERASERAGERAFEGPCAHDAYPFTRCGRGCAGLSMPVARRRAERAGMAEFVWPTESAATEAA